MAGLFTGTAENATSLVVAGLEVEFKRLVAEKLSAMAQEIVRAAAKEAAHYVVTRVESFQHLATQQLVVQVRFNNETL